MYVDDVFPAFKDLMLETAPSSLTLSFAKELKDKEYDEVLKKVDAIVVATEVVDEHTINQAENLKFIQKTGVGIDNIDVEAANRKGVPVANTPGMNATGVAELTILLTLALYRNLLYVHEHTVQGDWPMWDVRLESYEMAGKIHGLIGLGNIGKETAKRSQAFGTTVFYYDKFRLPVEEEERLGLVYKPFQELIAEADILSLHVPLLPETKHLLSMGEFMTMKPNTILINVARGGIVDEAALAKALATKEIAGAAIDVWEGEPVNKNNPLLSMDQVIATSHIGAGTKDTLKKVLNTAFTNTESYLAGKETAHIINQVNV